MIKKTFMRLLLYGSLIFILGAIYFVFIEVGVI